MGSVVKRYDVVAGRKYKARSGEDKTHWINVGEGAEWVEILTDKKDAA